MVASSVGIMRLEPGLHIIFIQAPSLRGSVAEQNPHLQKIKSSQRELSTKARSKT